MEALQAMSAADKVQALSTVLGGVADIKGGMDARRSADYRAGQLEQEAGQARAMSQRKAIEERRRANLVASSLRAKAEGGAGDPTVTDLAGDIYTEGEYRAMLSLYEGEERASGMESAAAASRYEGRQTRTAGFLKGAGGILTKGATMYEKYAPKRSDLLSGPPPTVYGPGPR